MRVRTPILLFVLIAAWVAPTAVWASADHEQDTTVRLKEGQSKGHDAKGHDKGHGHLSPWEADHWSLFNVVVPETARNEIQTKLGPTWFDKDKRYRLAHVFMTALVVFLIMLLVGSSRSRLTDPEKALIPEKKLTAYNFLEMMMEAVIEMMTQIMPEKVARKAFPLIGTLALFIFFGNVLGAIPGLLPATDNFNTTFACGIVVFVMYHYWGIQEHGAGPYLKHFLGPITAWYGLPLMILMFCIEIISHTVRPFSLGIRLMGNMFGDHQVLGQFLNFHLPLVPLPVMLLGLLVVVVQTLVFCLLSMVYIGMATAHTEH
ncbi:MAG: F0F1 ATP synthase subunit A [Myxococcales bacterium]|nr:F0F1 ATP synthase subunit A [Myxococcales bacterium]